MALDRNEHPTRREVMRAGLAAAGALALGQHALGAADSPEPGPYGPFKMGIQSYSLRDFPLEKALAISKDLGLRYWESFPKHIPLDLASASRVRRQIEDAGIKVIGYGVVPFGKDADANRKLFEFGKALGIEYFSADPTPDSFDNLDRLVEEFQINIGIHNHGPGHRYALIDGINAAIKDHSPRIGCCVDTGHFLRSKEDPVRAVEVFGKRVYGVHLKDVKDATKFTVLGEGDLRTAELLKKLAALKYSHCLALEYEEDPANPVDDIRACLAAVRKAAPKS